MANYEGGAIHNNGELTLTESVLSQNWAGYDGGAVFNNENLFLTKSTLKQNKAKHEGGAINNGLGGESSIMESDFTENIVQESGGAPAAEPTGHPQGDLVHRRGELSADAGPVAPAADPDAGGGGEQDQF